jgi:phosphoglycolate phosphatase
MPHSNGRCSPALLLFDIDGTLVRKSGPHHRQALVDGVRAIAGFDTSTEHIPVQGMLDRDILAWMLRDAGAGDTHIRQWMPRLVRRAQWIYSRTCPADLSDKVCPGVVKFLESVRQRRILAGLVSGNLTQIGWKKVQRAGLKDYFRFGAFSDRGATRADLVRLALTHASHRGWIHAQTPVALIGDHPNDIDAARKNRVLSVAVATGLVTKEELASHTPDFLVDDLRKLHVEFITA